MCLIAPCVNLGPDVAAVARTATNVHALGDARASRAYMKNSNFPRPVHGEVIMAELHDNIVIIMATRAAAWNARDRYLLARRSR